MTDIFEKLDLQTPDFVNENVAKLAELFPNCVTEKRNDKGELEHAIDFDALRQEFSSTIVEGSAERYSLNWPGKRKALVAANTPINKTLRPCRNESVDFDTTKNIFIEGDNLDALKLLQETYLGKIKMIYIDPPYNTGRDFIYNDSFTASKEDHELASEQKNDEGGRLVSNLESNGRFHSDWLSMIYPRLKLARNLLNDNGIIFISIDDNEQANLTKVCDEIFGEDNFFANLVVVRSEGGGLAKKVIKGHDSLLIYTKNCHSFKGIKKPKDIRGKIIKKDGREYWIEEDWLRKEFGKYGTLLYEDIERIKGIDKKKEIDDGINKGIYQLINKNGKHIVGRLRALDEDGSKFYSIIKHLNKNGVKDLSEIKLDDIFDFPKPVSLVKELVLGATIFSKNQAEITLDFFAGSGTTAHAVMKLNAEDGGNRKCISVQLPEVTDEKSEAYKAGYKNIAEISKERIRRAGKKIKENNADKEGIENLDTGFRVFKIDSSNMEDVHLTPDDTKLELFDALEGNIKPDRSAEDLLFQVLLDWGVDLSLPIERTEIDGKQVFFVDNNALAACFDENINEEFVKKLAERQPLRAVFRDDGFANDAVKINIEQIFKLKSPATDIKVI